MVKKIVSILLMTGILFGSLNVSKSEAAPAPIGVKWGNSILIPGQIGKVTILQETNLYQLTSTGELKFSRKLEIGSEYRVYSFLSSHGGLYGVGGGMYVKKSPQVKYETPSTIKKQQIQRILFFDQGMLTLAEKGILKGQAISIDGTHDIKEVYGLNNTLPKIEQVHAGLAHTFHMYTYFTQYPYNHHVYSIEWKDDNFVPITPYVITQRLGKPIAEGKSEVDGKWFMVYPAGNYNLYIHFRGNSSSQLDLLRLKKD